MTTGDTDGNAEWRSGFLQLSSGTIRFMHSSNNGTVKAVSP